jgi:hypothetical protein
MAQTRTTIPLVFYNTGKTADGIQWIVKATLPDGTTLSRDFKNWRRTSEEIFECELVVIDDPASDKWLAAYMGASGRKVMGG